MPTKVSHTIPCSSAFRDAVEALAKKRGCNVADLARSAVLLLPSETINHVSDPGGPEPGDREVVARINSDATPLRRKPRLQVRMPPGHDAATIRRALALALMLDNEKATIDVELPGVSGAPASTARRDREEEILRLRASLDAVSFEPLPDGIETRKDALYVLGFPPDTTPCRETLRNRFRVLATVYHPDGPYGNHRRMAQLNDAMALLRR